MESPRGLKDRSMAIVRFQKATLELAKAGDDTDTVFHFNILAFPLSRPLSRWPASASASDKE